MKAESEIKHALLQLKSDAYATTLTAQHKLESKNASEQTAAAKVLEKLLQKCNANLKSALKQVRKLSSVMKDMRVNVS